MFFDLWRRRSSRLGSAGPPARRFSEGRRKGGNEGREINAAAGENEQEQIYDSDLSSDNI